MKGLQKVAYWAPRMEKWMEEQMVLMKDMLRVLRLVELWGFLKVVMKVEYLDIN